MSLKTQCASWLHFPQWALSTRLLPTRQSTPLPQAKDTSKQTSPKGHPESGGHTRGCAQAAHPVDVPKTCRASTLLDSSCWHVRTTSELPPCALIPRRAQEKPLTLNRTGGQCWRMGAGWCPAETRVKKHRHAEKCVQEDLLEQDDCCKGPRPAHGTRAQRTCSGRAGCVPAGMTLTQEPELVFLDWSVDSCVRAKKNSYRPKKQR